MGRGVCWRGANPARWSVFYLCLIVSACGAPWPNLDDGADAVTLRTADFPTLAPMDDLLMRADAILPRSAADDGAALQTRRENLERRSDTLRQQNL